MRFRVPCTALGLALAAGAPAAHAQTYITPSIVGQSMETAVVQPAQTVQTTETIRTVRPLASRTVRRQVVTTRTITRQYVPSQTIVARGINAAPQPLYDEVTAGPIAASGTDYSYGRGSDYRYSRPLYDQVTLPLAPAVSAVPADSYMNVPTYRYVYEPDRILVIDPSTGVAVQALPR